MASLDVQSLFTKIPLEETITVCCDSLLTNDCKVYNFIRIDFEKLFRAVVQNNVLNFKGKTSNQIERVSIRFPLGPTLANAFLCFQEEIWLN